MCGLGEPVENLGNLRFSFKMESEAGAALPVGGAVAAVGALVGSDGAVGAATGLGVLPQAANIWNDNKETMSKLTFFSTWLSLHRCKWLVFCLHF